MLNIEKTLAEIKTASPERFAEIKAELRACTNKVATESALHERKLVNAMIGALVKSNAFLNTLKNFAPAESQPKIALQIASNTALFGKLNPTAK